VARLDLRRFNCLACHSRDGEGGLRPGHVDELRRQAKADHAEAVSPPPLTGVGHKLRTPWLRQVLTGAGRARPWLGLRMPQFGEAQVGRLPEALAALEGAAVDNTVHKVALTPAQLEAGRWLVGKKSLGCISCHDLAGNPNHGTRGPDLATSPQRVRHDWYLRWLEQPQRLAPGTQMPTVFQGGKTLLDQVLGGDPRAQAEAMWGYMTLAAMLPLPEGAEPPKGTTAPKVGDRPVVLRTLLPEAGPRAIAVGFPGGVSAAFDTQAGRLAYAWSGNFLDAAPAWDDRDANPARPLGKRFWTAPPGCPVGLSPNSEPPDFLRRAKDPAYGGPPPTGKTFDGTPLLRFRGDSTDKGGIPTFRYDVETAEGLVAEVSERVEPLTSKAAVGLKRGFTVRVPPRQNGWLFAGQTEGKPRLLDAKGEPVALDLEGDLTEVPAQGRLLVLPQDGDRVVVLTVPAAPEHSTWHLRRNDGTWQALLRLPPLEDTGKVQVQLGVWVPFRDEPAVLKELAGPSPRNAP
jgi:hypothetical protein